MPNPDEARMPTDQRPNGRPMTPARRDRVVRALGRVAAIPTGCLLLLAALPGCGNDLAAIDARVSALLGEAASDLGGGAIAPPAGLGDTSVQPYDDLNQDPTSEDLRTANPSAEELLFDPRQEVEDAVQRLAAYDVIPADALEIDLVGALEIATRQSREYRFAQEEFVLAAISLLIERHQWGPRFFDDLSVDFAGDGDDGIYDTTLSVVNEFRITQRLPYGGEVGVRAVARAIEQLRERVSDRGENRAEIILDANIPLLRDAGTIARESRIQSERNLIYGARTFERFRRSFLVDIATDFLDLGVTLRQIANARRQVESLEELESREQALYRAGRRTPFETALAENATVEARDRLNSVLERYRLDLDRFKVRIGLRPDDAVVIVPLQLDTQVPDVTLEEAVSAALSFRLDLQTTRDRVDDSIRGVSNARNQLLPDLDLAGSVTIPTDEDDQRSLSDLDADDTDVRAGLTLGLPLDRDIERLNVRDAEIRLERSRRSYQQARDNVVIDARSAVRTIDRSLFSLEIQERNVEIAQLRLESIRADPSRATVRDESDAINQVLSAEDALDSAKRDLSVAVLHYLLDTGQLRVQPDGFIQPLEGMRSADELIRFIDSDEEQEPGRTNRNNGGTPGVGPLEP